MKQRLTKYVKSYEKREDIAS